ncbi:methyltransf_25 domain-containing protein [Nephila pilipes]|uniref:Methyltransf_25 domain-containing protein n=1 Tax=Nephila pilipes TaxID=299642 RepID=A0A8X6NXD4_NEPPI|nr:methyltransf_25 domain-containing protein [Nephila pilipes]
MPSTASLEKLVYIKINSFVGVFHVNKMPLNYDVDIYSQLDNPWDSIVRFLNITLREMGWSNGDQEEVVMDVGCGPGRLTSEFILRIFPNLKKIIALDAESNMIEKARCLHPHPKIEYDVANFEDRSLIELWNGKITKFISVHCFNRMQDQKGAFQRVYDLLPPNGEAGFVFLLHNGYYDALQYLAKDLKWCSYIPFDIEDCIPKSHAKGYTSFHYKKMLEGIGFEIRHCQQVQNVTTFLSDELYTDFLYSVCELTPYIPNDVKKDFKKDLLHYTLKQNGRNDDGTPVDRTTTLELVQTKSRGIHHQYAESSLFGFLAKTECPCSRAHGQLSLTSRVPTGLSGPHVGMVWML